jgi:hypothetical protein
MWTLLDARAEQRSCRFYIPYAVEDFVFACCLHMNKALANEAYGATATVIHRTHVGLHIAPPV